MFEIVRKGGASREGKRGTGDVKNKKGGKKRKEAAKQTSLSKEV